MKSSLLRRPLLELDGLQELDALVFKHLDLASPVALGIIDVGVHRSSVRCLLDYLLFDSVAATVEVRANYFSLDGIIGSVDDNLLPSVTVRICTLQSTIVQHSVIVELLDVGNSSQTIAGLPVMFE